MPEGTKDGLAGFHFADAEDRLSTVGVVVGLGSAIKLSSEDLEKFRGRRVRIVADADTAGKDVTARIRRQLASCAAEVQVFELAGLNRDDDLPVKDFFDATQIGYESFEANRDLWSVTDLNTKGDRIRIIGSRGELPPLPTSPPHESPKSHGFPVYPVSNSHELEKELEELAVRNACTERDTARQRRWRLARDLVAIEKRILRKLSLNEQIQVFDKWSYASRSYLDPKKTRDVYLAAFLSELRKVRVPTGEGEALKKALEQVWSYAISDLPELPMPDAPESWRRLAALHRELARQSANGTYFLGCRDAAKAHPSFNKDSANNVQRVLSQPEFGVISFVRVGDSRPTGKASEFRYLMPIA